MWLSIRMACRPLCGRIHHNLPTLKSLEGVAAFRQEKREKEEGWCKHPTSLLLFFSFSLKFWCFFFSIFFFGFFHWASRRSRRCSWLYVDVQSRARCGGGSGGSGAFVWGNIPNNTDEEQRDTAPAKVIAIIYHFLIVLLCFYAAHAAVPYQSLICIKYCKIRTTYYLYVLLQSSQMRTAHTSSPGYIVKCTILFTMQIKKPK